MTEPTTRSRPAPPRAAGFTLVELLVTTALLVVVIALLMVPIYGSFRYFRSATARADAQSAGRVALDAVARELTEAMYVQLDMYDNTMLAFIPPLRVDPYDPNSEIITPPRPDWSRAIRYWRALHDPTMNYNPGSHLGPGNTYYVARTVIPDPFTTDDPWNRWNDDWAAYQNATPPPGALDWPTNWAPISRMVHTDVDTYLERRTTLQPGYPYLYSQSLVSPLGPSTAGRIYRDNVVAMTPNETGYDVPRLEFQPTVVAGEWLRPVERDGRPDYSVLQAHYPLWRLGAPYTGWASLTAYPPLAFPDWARDPFILIYRPNPTTGMRDLLAAGMFDPRTRTIKVINPYDGTVVYDTGDYPVRTGSPEWPAFGVNWIDGSLRFDFPPPHPNTEDMLEGEPWVLAGDDLLGAASPEGPQKYDAPLPLWEGRTTPGSSLSTFIVPDSVEVWTDTAASGVPDRVLARVACTPRERSDQYQLGLEPASAHPNYGWIRLPQTLADGSDSKNAHSFWVHFRWRNNGFWSDGIEYPDQVSAYYRTAAVLDISLTVVRAGPGARWETRLSQSANMTRRVKLRNLLRRIRYAEE